MTRILLNRKLFLLILFFICFFCIAQDNIDQDNEYLDFGVADGITIFGESLRDFAPESIENNILSTLNSSLSDRKNFIENNLLENAGFRRTGNIRFRNTNTSEKALSVLHGIVRPFSFGVVPIIPFFEVDQERLPNGVYYPFEVIINSSELNNISPVVIKIMEIEYMLQIEFCNGILTGNHINYYTLENINKFERLILELPEYQENIKKLKERYLYIELPKIRHSLERYNNPGDNYLRAMENLKDIFRRN